MSTDVVLWVLGVAVTVLMGSFAFLATWCRRQDDQLGEMRKDHEKLARHTAENYVRGHEIAEVKKAVADLRQEMTGAVGELRTEVSHQIGELTKAVYQLLGQQKTNK